MGQSWTGWQINERSQKNRNVENWRGAKRDWQKSFKHNFWFSKKSEKRLHEPGALKLPPTSDINKEYYDHYKYYDINMKSKEFNIKMVYKVLAMLFKKIKSNKTIITITGKYGERGYSFTSDYYKKDNKYVLHLTDQYFVSHASKDCTNIFQRGRIQGRYTDNPNLIFWTTKELVNTINNYVDLDKGASGDLHC